MFCKLYDTAKNEALAWRLVRAMAMAAEAAARATTGDCLGY
jgi:hypothetical protein